MMLENNLHNSLPVDMSLKYIDINDNLQKTNNREKNFERGLQNARKLLKGLEHSLRKTNKYEHKLMTCKSSHAHPHDVNEWWASEESSKCSNSKETMKSSKSDVNLVESWSTMSMVCLQYQYDQLSKRYSDLLREHEEGCARLHAREGTLAKVRAHARLVRARLMHVHRTLLIVGEKYLVLKDRRDAQKAEYESRIAQARETVRSLAAAAARARLALDARLARAMASQDDAATALLLAEVSAQGRRREIRKCNLLYLENLRLKAQLEELVPGHVKWEEE